MPLRFLQYNAYSRIENTLLTLMHSEVLSGTTAVIGNVQCITRHVTAGLPVCAKELADITPSPGRFHYSFCL